MNIKAYQRFKESYQCLPKSIQKKVDKQIAILAENFRHPSLHTKRIKGSNGIWEVRVDVCYRLSFEIIDDVIYLRVVGNHDNVLEKP